MCEDTRRGGVMRVMRQMKRWCNEGCAMRMVVRGEWRVGAVRLGSCREVQGAHTLRICVQVELENEVKCQRGEHTRGRIDVPTRVTEAASKPVCTRHLA